MNRRLYSFSLCEICFALLVAGNKCLKHGKRVPYVNPIEPGKLLRQISKSYHLTPSPPLPVLHDSNVTEPHLPSVSGNFPIFGAAR